MRLLVIVPTRTVLDVQAERVSAQGKHGSFTLLPRHVDCVAPLVPGLLRLVDGDEERFVAVDGGMLVKCGQEVLVSTPEAIESATLEELRARVDEAFLERSEHEHRARQALARLESDAVRRLVEIDEHA